MHLHGATKLRRKCNFQFNRKPGHQLNKPVAGLDTNGSDGRALVFNVETGAQIISIMQFWQIKIICKTIASPARFI